MSKLFSNSNSLTLTVGVITKDRPEYLYQCLKSIRSQGIDDLAILVSDDSEFFSDRNREICSQFTATYLSGPRNGLYANRNNIFDSATTSHLLTCDDDHLYPPNFLINLLAHISIYPYDILVVSELSSSDESNPFLRAPRYINSTVLLLLIIKLTL